MGEESKRVIESGPESEGGLEILAGKAIEQKPEIVGGRWRYILSERVYSPGPGDNVYVYG